MGRLRSEGKKGLVLMLTQCLERTWHTEGWAETVSVGLGFVGRDEGGARVLKWSSSRQEPELDSRKSQIQASLDPSTMTSCRTSCLDLTMASTHTLS